MPAKTLSRSKRWAFLALLSLFLLAFAETAARVAYVRIDGRPFDFARIHEEQDLLRFEASASRSAQLAAAYFADCRIHPYLGFTYAPDAARGVHPSGFLAVEEFPPRRSSDRVVVGVFGGSVALATRLSAGDQLAERFARIPRFAGRKVVLFAAAVGGYKQPQSLLALSYLYSLGAEFDVVVLLDGFNETALAVYENASRGLAVSDPRSWHLLLGARPGGATAPQALEIHETKLARARWARRFSTLPVRHSAFACLAWKARDRALERRLMTQAEALRLTPADPGEYRVLSDQERREALEEAGLVWKRCSFAMAALSKAHGAEYLHFLQPNQYDPGSKPLSPEERRRAFVEDSPYRSAVADGYPILRRHGEALREQSVAFVDLSRLFSQVETTVYDDGCCHFNELGYRMLAEAIADAVAPDPSMASIKVRAPR